jgi:hypothetical protein
MDAAAYAAMADPLKNRQFNRPWIEPPDGRRRRPGQGATLLNFGNRNANSLTIDDAAAPAPRRPA